MFQLQKWRFPGLGGQGVAVAMRAAAGPIETVVSVAKVKVSRPGWPGCALAMRAAVGPIETIVSVAKVKVFRAGGQSVCFLEALGTTFRHAQRSGEVGGLRCGYANSLSC